MFLLKEDKGAGDIIQLVQCLASMLRYLVQLHACNSNTCELKAGVAEIQGHSKLSFNKYSSS